MAVKHLAEGSVKPTLKDNVTYLFSMRFCPYAHRAHLILNAKNVKKMKELHNLEVLCFRYEIIYINLSSKPKWYLELFPAGRVPALFYKGDILYESVLLADFLNEEFPENPLHSSEPVKKFKDKLLVENFGKVGSAFYKNAMVEFNSQNFEELLNSIDEFESEIIKRGTKYFGGNEKPLMVDYLMWPWFERIVALAVLNGKEAEFPTNRFPNLVKWMSLMKTDKYVQTHYLTPEQYAKHFKLRKANDPGAFDNVL